MTNVYLITGASGDIGLGVIKAVFKDGDIVLAQGTGDMEKLEALQKELGSSIQIFNANLSTQTGIETFVEQLKATGLTPTHFLHLPALRVVNTKFKNFDYERYLLDMNVQISSALFIAKWALPEMARAGYGRVVFMLTSYILGVPPKNITAYMVAKSAMEGLAKSLAIDYAQYGVTVNSVSPSLVETNFLAETSSLIVEAAAKAHPLGRNATVADVVPPIAFLLSEESRFITGVNLPITGGSVF